jgi:hypothetical protein
LGILLEHQYTPASLSSQGFKALKGADNDRVSLILYANERLPAESRLNFYICNASLFINAQDVSGYEGRYRKGRHYYDSDSEDATAGYYEWEIYERVAQIENWYDQTGACVFQNYQFEFDIFTRLLDPNQPSAIIDLNEEDSWGKYLKQDFEGYSGNAGATRETTYGKYILVCWPKKYEFNVLIKLDLTITIDSLYDQVMSTSTGVADLHSHSDQFARMLVNFSENKPSLNDHCITRLFQILSKLSNVQLVLDFLKIQKPQLTLENSGDFIKLVAQFGFEKLKDYLISMLKMPAKLSLTCHFIKV